MDWQAYHDKANSNVRAARLTFEAGEYDSCVSRCYYAVFHAAIAALLRLTDYRPKMKEGKAEWNHAIIAAEFNARLVQRRKVFRSDLAEVPAKLIKFRHQADYSEVRMSERIARRCLTDAEEFVKAVNERLEESE